METAVSNTVHVSYLPSRIDSAYQRQNRGPRFLAVVLTDGLMTNAAGVVVKAG